MAKLTKAQRRQIEGALESITKALAFINSDRIELCRVSEINAQCAQGPNDYRACVLNRSQTYRGNDGESWSIDYVRELSPIDKGVGSDLVRLYTAQDLLRDLLKEGP